MKNCVQILLKCYAPEQYEFVTHAVVKMDAVLVELLIQRIGSANDLKSACSEFLGLEYSRYDPKFMDVPLGVMDKLDMSEEEFDAICDEGYHVLPVKMDDYDWNEVGMRPCMLMVMAGDNDTGSVHWVAYDKHIGTAGRVETYSLRLQDLHEIAAHLRKGNKKFTVEIPEVHKVAVEVELPEGSTLDQITEAAQAKFEAADDLNMEYSHTLEPDNWTVRDENGTFVS